MHDSLSTRPAGEGAAQSEFAADRFMVLDSSEGKRHAGALKFFDGINELGAASVTSASPGSASTTSDRRSSGVIAASKMTWSAIAGARGNERSQTVKKDYTFSNISPVAGQLKLTVELESFSKIEKIKINGEELKDVLETPDFTARLESERWGGSKVHVTMKLGAGTEEQPKKADLKIEVAGKFNINE